MVGAMNSPTKEAKYTARRNVWGNTSLFKGSSKIDCGWLPDAFARQTEHELKARGHTTLRVVTSEGTTADFAIGSYEAWHALFHAAGDYSKFTIFAK